MSDERGKGADVRYVRSAENRSAGSVMSRQFAPYCDAAIHDRTVRAKLPRILTATVDRAQPPTSPTVTSQGDLRADGRRRCRAPPRRRADDGPTLPPTTRPWRNASDE